MDRNPLPLSPAPPRDLRLPLGPSVLLSLPRSLRPLLVGLVVLWGGCASRIPRMPGPLGSVGKDAPPVAVLRPLPLNGEEEEEEGPAPSRPADSALGRRIAKAAAHYLEHRPRGFRDDCSGFVMASLDRAGVPTSGSTRTFWDHARELGTTHKRKRPSVGDLVFFDNTYDRNRNGRFDDDLTHIGIVIGVDEDDTITIAHGGTGRGRTTLTMNLRHPDVRRDDDGLVRNDYLRRRLSSDPKHFKYLAGELWRGFATVDADALADGGARQ
mgnify:CR=1 FL=1